MSKTQMLGSRSRPDILRWLPSQWETFLGNQTLKLYFKKLVQQIRTGFRKTGAVPDESRLSLMITGESRSGKTAIIRHLVRCLTCKCLNESTLNPCDRTCETCRQKVEQFGLEGLFATCIVGSGEMEVHFTVVDCTKIQSPEQLRGQLISLSDWDDGLRIIYLDEVHRLVQRRMDEMFLKEVDDKRFLWICSTAKPQQLEDMFVNRFIKLKTQLPAARELEDWLVDRCAEGDIACEPEAIVRVVEKCNKVVGTALHALALAALDPEAGLTLGLVENDWNVKQD